MPVFLLNLKKHTETKRAEAETFEVACESLGWNPVDCEGVMRLADNWIRIIQGEGDKMTITTTNDPLEDGSVAKLDEGFIQEVMHPQKPRKPSGENGIPWKSNQEPPRSGADKAMIRSFGEAKLRKIKEESNMVPDRSNDELTEGLNSEGLTLKKTRKPRADKGLPHKKEVPVVATRSRRKPNITEADVGSYYVSPKGQLYKLLSCGRVVMDKVGNGDGDAVIDGMLSDFADFRRLVVEPERKRSKKEGK